MKMIYTNQHKYITFGMIRVFLANTNFSKFICIWARIQPKTFLKVGPKPNPVKLGPT